MKLKIFAAFTAACVMAVGLAFGQDVESEIYYSDFFDTYSVGDTISNMNEVVKANMQTTSYLGTWSSGEADMTKIANDGNNYLALDTAGDVVTNTLLSADEINDVLSGGGEVTFTTEMKLIPSDEIESSFVDAFDANGPTTIVDNGDLKFGLYAYEYDVTKTVDGVEVVDVVTNLVVYHSYYKYDSATGKTGFGYTNNVIELNNVPWGESITVVTTLKKFDNEMFFSVAIDGYADEITSPLGCTDDAFTEEKLDITVCPSVDGGKWFRCVHNGNNNKITALNLSGTGAVKGIELSAVEGEGGGEGGDDTEEITLSWDEFAGFADTTVGETATAEVKFNLSGANDATVTIAGDSAFAITDQTTLGTVIVTFKPTEAKEYTATLTVTAGDKSADLSITGTGVAAGEPALTYPDDSAITDAALLAWLTGKNATQAQIDALGTVEALNEKYLLNLDLENSSYTLKIKSLAVGDDVKVEVELTRFNGETAVEAAINGKLQLWGTTDLGTAFEDCGLSEISNADFSEGTTAVKIFPAKGVKFFKAVIANPTAAE